MRPLREEIGSSDAETAREARLLRAMSPLQPSLASMQRVRMAVEARPARWWHALGAHPVLTAAGGAALALLVMAQVQLRSTVAAVAGADSAEARQAAHHRAEAARANLAGTAPQVAPALPGSGTDSTPAIGAPARPEWPVLAPASPMVAGAGGAGVTPAVGASSLQAAQVPALDTPGVKPQTVPMPLAPQLPPLVNPLPLTNEVLTPGGMLAVTPREATPREAMPLVGAEPAPNGGAAPALAGGAGFGTVVGPLLPAAGPDSGRGGGNGGGSGQVTPPGPGGDHPAPAPGGGRHPGNWEAAVVAARDSTPDGHTVALAFNGSLDGRPVSGTVLWRRGDDSIHALVLHSDESDVVQATALHTPLSVDAASETGIDLDNDGQDDVLLAVDPEGSEQECTRTVGTIPAVTVMLRITP